MRPAPPTADSAPTADAVAEGAGTPGRQLLNINHLRLFTGGDLALEQEILGLFLNQLPQTLLGAEAAVDADHAWIVAVHTLKGSALAVGAEQLADAAAAALAIPADDRSGRLGALGVLARTIAATADDIARRDQDGQPAGL